MRKSELRRIREGKIISSLNKLGVADIRLIKRLNISNLGITSDRNVLRVMNRMVDDGLLDSVRKEIKLYAIKGRGFGHYEHRMMMNEFLVYKGLFYKAKIEPKIKLGGDIFKPDFIVPRVDNPKNEQDWTFYEVDRRQKKKANMLKIERYKRLGLHFEVVCKPERNYMWKDCIINNM